MKDLVGPLLMISEIRAIAGDSFWMSPCYQQRCAAFHFTWKQDWNGLQQILPDLEKMFMSYGARPHWGKIFTMPPDYLASQYVRIHDFRELLQEYDPKGKFRNEFMDRNIFGG
jgi:xylitol oxidase